MKLDVRTFSASLGGVMLYDSATGQPLPGQKSGNLYFGADLMPELTITFGVDGRDIRMGDNTQATVSDAQHAAQRAQEENDLQAAFRAFGALSMDNRRRFFAALDLRTGSDVRAAAEELCGRDKDRMVKTLTRLDQAVSWALGQNGDFRARRAGEGNYWWRRELRRRAYPEE